MSSQTFGNLHQVPLQGLFAAMQMLEASNMTNAAGSLQGSGDLAGAEERHKQALKAKKGLAGGNDVSSAISHDNLGRVQLKMGKLDEAEANFRRALEIRKDMSNESWDNSVTRENLAQVLEAKGDLNGAKEVRLSHGKKVVCCAHYECPVTFQYLKKLNNTCTGCECVYYCSVSCREADWEKRHKDLCHAPADAE